MAGNILFTIDTDFGHYEVVDTIYNGRPARILYSGDQLAAQSGIAQDDSPDLLFDYNQRFLELTEGLRPKRLLVIGGGAYTLPTTLINQLPNIQIDVIERDPDLQQIAQKYFNLQSNSRLRIIHGDGRRYIDKSQHRYDAIFVDAFTHTTIENNLAELAALRAMSKLLTSDGVLALNIIAAYYGRRGSILWQTHDRFKTVFGTASLFPAGHDLSLWIAQNFILTGQKNSSIDLREFLRFEPLPIAA